MIGKAISHYRITAKLGEGGMGIVYRAEDAKLGRDVALKFLPPEWTRDPDAKARFLHEARAAAALNHPNICTIYEVDEADDQTFIAMDLVEGESLKDRIGRGPLKISDALALAIQIAEGLAAAHAKDIVHRDVKPGNVMVTRDGRARIMDFGLAKVRGQTRLTRTGSTTGTVAYMSPEQSLAEDVDRRTDIWSFGVLLYEMVTGVRPFRGDYDQAVVHAILNEEPEPMTGLRTGVPMELERIAKKAMTKRVDERYQHMDDVLADLKALKRSIESSATVTVAARPAEPERAGRRASGTRRAVVSLLLVVAAATFVVMTMRARREAATTAGERVVVARFENRTGDASLDPIGSMAADLVTSGIAETNIVSVVPPVTAAQMRPAEVGGDAAAAHKELARSTGANIVVSGSYYLHADTLEFRADITDPARGVLIRAIPPVGGPRADPMKAIEQVRQKVMGALALHVGTVPFGTALVGEGATPPTYDAYREYAAGLRLFGQDPAQALPHFERAAAMDTSFVAPRFYRMICYANMAEYAEADSVLRAIGQRRSRLTPPEALLLDMETAYLRGNYGEALRATRRLEALAPDDWVVKYLIASMALWLNRPREVVAALSSLDEHPEVATTYAGSWRYDVQAAALHLLGEYKKELAVIRRAREAYPDVVWLRGREARALAGLGRLEDVTAVVNEALAAPRSGRSTAGGVIHAAARALRVRGHRTESIAMANREVEWRRALVEGKSVAEDPSGYRGLAGALYAAERWDEARAILEELGALDPTDSDMKGYLGVLAARRGDKREAERILDELKQSRRPYSFGHDVYWAACIAAQLGERDRAVELLRASFARGMNMAPDPMWDMDLEPLHGYRPYEELMKPKG